jgi:hypothetical protein
LLSSCDDVSPQAPWSFRSSSIGPEALPKLIEEARIINRDIDKGTVRYKQLSSDTTKIQNDLDVGLKPLVSSAVDGMNILGQSIVDLYNVPDKSGTSATNLIAKCKGQGQVVARRFDNLHTHSQDILRRAGDVSDNALMNPLILLMERLTCRWPLKRQMQ